MNDYFSTYKSVQSNTPTGVSTLQQWTDPRNFPGIEEKINVIREEPEKNQRSILKKTLPIATISGVFSYRNISHCINHSGLIALDFDNLGDDPESIRDYIYKLPFVIFAGLSVSGHGVWAVVPIAYPNKHKQHFKSLVSDFEAIGLSIDPAPSSIASARFISVDTTYNVKTMPEIYYRLTEEPKVMIQPQHHYTSTANEKKVLNTIKKMIRDAPDGEKRYQLFKASRLAGGYIQSGIIDEQTALQTLEESIRKKDNVHSIVEALNTIKRGIYSGRNKPILTQK